MCCNQPGKVKVCFLSTFGRTLTMRNCQSLQINEVLITYPFFQRIMEFAENLAENHEYEKDLGERLTKSPSEGGYHYFNAKKVRCRNHVYQECILRVLFIYLKKISLGF